MKEMEKEPVRQIPAPDSGGKEEFPAGMRVLAVDDDPTCLKVLENLLQKCRYKVTVTPRAATALELLRERKDKFDIVISDVHMPDMDGFKLLEIVGLEMDLPVIMMSANSDYSTVLKGIKHGARDYLLKPIRIEQLKNIWQHVIRKTLLEPKEGNDITDKDKCGTKGVGDGATKATRKCRDQSEEKEHEADDPSVEDPASQKKQRINWSGELHSQFISAVEHLGVENAVPKRILDLMNTPWLTRENVASHLQKYRKGLRRKSAGMNHNGTTSDRIDSDPPTALQSFDKQHPDAVNCLDGFKMDGSSNNSDIIQLGHVRNPGTFSISPVKTQSLPFLLPNSQDVLFQQYRSPKAEQLYQIMQTPGLGDVSTDGLNLLSISPRPDQLETFTGVSSHIPSYYASDKSGATPNCSPEYVSKGHPLGIFFDAAESSCSKVSDSVATDLGAISPLGTALNSLPGQCKGQNVGDFHRSLVHLDLGTSLELQSCKGDRFMGSGQLKPAEDPDPPMDLWMDNIFDLSGSRSPEDLGAILKQEI